MGVDIAGAIKLVSSVRTTDGKQQSMIFDAAGPYRYEVTADGKSITAVRWWNVVGRTWKKDRDYDPPAGVLVISDDYSATKRTLRVHVLDGDGLIESPVMPLDETLAIMRVMDRVREQIGMRYACD